MNLFEGQDEVHQGNRTGRIKVPRETEFYMPSKFEKVISIISLYYTAKTYTSQEVGL